ncbi:hypothetical protein HY988_06120 [Candidatus Micrarchaeota archaeon]|nr:hypothetical protein [Candidatus Micrarchaeota archaeon]
MSLSFTQFAEQTFLKVNAEATAEGGQRYQVEVLYAAQTINFAVDQILTFVLKIPVESVKGTKISVSSEIVPAPAEFLVRVTKSTAETEGQAQTTSEFLIVKDQVDASGRAPYKAVSREKFDPVIFMIPPSAQLTDQQREVLAQLSAYSRIDATRLVATTFAAPREITLPPPSAKPQSRAPVHAR